MPKIVTGKYKSYKILVNNVVRKLRAGKTVSETAKETGADYNVVRRIGLAHGITLKKAA